MSGSEEFEAVCPSCGERLTVNDSMRRTLVENGCVVCGSELSPEAFTRR